MTPDVEYAVIDDIRGGITYFPGWKDWLGCQPEFMVRRLHMDAKLFKWGRPTIWCANKDPREEMMYWKLGERVYHKGFGSEDIEWLDANCIFVEITDPTFHANIE